MNDAKLTPAAAGLAEEAPLKPVEAALKLLAQAAPQPVRDAASLGRELQGSIREIINGS